MSPFSLVLKHTYLLVFIVTETFCHVLFFKCFYIAFEKNMTMFLNITRARHGVYGESLAVLFDTLDDAANL